jgi:hypothetical protein
MLKYNVMNSVDIHYINQTKYTIVEINLSTEFVKHFLKWKLFVLILGGVYGTYSYFIYGLFYDAISCSDDIALNGRMTSE